MLGGRRGVRVLEPAEPSLAHTVWARPADIAIRAADDCGYDERITRADRLQLRGAPRGLVTRAARLSRFCCNPRAQAIPRPFANCASIRSNVAASSASGSYTASRNS